MIRFRTMLRSTMDIFFLLGTSMAEWRDEVLTTVKKVTAPVTLWRESCLNFVTLLHYRVTFFPAILPQPVVFWKKPETWIFKVNKNKFWRKFIFQMLLIAVLLSCPNHFSKFYSNKKKNIPLKKGYLTYSFFKYDQNDWFLQWMV